jgi:hypothetical protein
MKCKDCSVKYVGQRGRTFNTRYKEHICYIKSNNSNTGYSRHILDTRHTYGTMEDTMDVVRISRKGQYLNALKKYYIHKISREKIHMNDTNIDEHNPIFGELQKIYNAPTSRTTDPSPPAQSRNIQIQTILCYTHITVKHHTEYVRKNISNNQNYISIKMELILTSNSINKCCIHYRFQ